jgi:hypothetical protein
MARLAAKGIEVYLPDGWEGRIFQRTPSDGARAYPVTQFATFALPADTADFGGGVPAAMRPSDIFAVLFEYGPESMGRPLFARPNLPRHLSPADFHTYTLRVGAGGQSGTQWFFTEQRRPFTLYAVLGSHALRSSLVPKLNLLLNQVTIHPGGARGAA